MRRLVFRLTGAHLHYGIRLRACSSSPAAAHIGGPIKAASATDTIGWHHHISSIVAHNHTRYIGQVVADVAAHFLPCQARPSRLLSQVMDSQLPAEAPPYLKYPCHVKGQCFSDSFT
jgi:hypothetical protein